jgi:hypothetical protein
MKALSIRQPWAWLIVHGLKPVENRSWSTSHRGPTLIHASQVFDTDGLNSVLRAFPDLRCRMPQQYSLGGIVGRADLVDCVQQHSSAWFTGPYGFVISNPQPVPFVRLRGQLAFFEVQDECVSAALRHADASAAAGSGQPSLF